MASNSHEIVPAHLVVQAMRDNGYKNAAYAIAELIDNSIQAEATEVELLCGEQQVLLEQRQRSRIEKIAVLDNGRGMNVKDLRVALQFGNGNYLEPEKHTGIGRFGMGLPSSSISQCLRVDVWSWQNGVGNAFYTYLDLNEIKNKKITEVPEPIAKEIPDIWHKIGKGFGQSGTLVVWSQIDRCIWKKGKTIIENSEFIIGRMYRKFLETKKVSIRMAAFDLDTSKIIEEKRAFPNDPGYLMEKTSCPEPFHETAMFQEWVDKENSEMIFSINFQEEEHKVTVRFSYAKEEARQAPPGQQPGSLPHGKHAQKNIGVSIVRAGRELEMDQSLVINYDPVERWWGIEVEFPPSLDDLFGVTNNKQSARNFAELINVDIQSMLTDDQSITLFKEELKNEGDPRLPLIEVAERIQKTVKNLRNAIKQQTIGTRTQNKRHQENSAVQVATARTKKRQEEGHQGQSDQDECLPIGEREQLLEQTFTEEGLTEKQAHELAASLVNDGLKYNIQEGKLDTPAFFSVRPQGGVIVVTLNTNHPAYKNLVEVLEQDVEGVDEETLRLRLSNSLEGLKLLLCAWARYEDEQPEQRRPAAQQARADWGTIARDFLEREE
ncbi:ATP-binding protein [Laspinema olomoucense]|uniref:ATP-binding protein n=1 Tax=Laspinema olomoucense TaxID=3231600 RepID=UPI0021BB93A5|nr:ATP-binding protein [Laspinema sp. D3d]MCT7973510.1 ATP-binding protein [Laspinema sp. D3d]